jgi:biopolymer transport protein ExbB/TolQ
MSVAIVAPFATKYLRDPIKEAMSEYETARAEKHEYSRQIEELTRDCS